MKQRRFNLLTSAFYLFIIISLSCAKSEDDAPDNKAEQPLNSVSSVGEGKAFGTNAVYENLLASDVVRITAGNTTFFAGYKQVSSNNQNPIFAKYVDGQKIWSRTDYETTGDDCRGYGIIWDGSDNLYAVFSTTGTQGDSENDFRRFAQNGWQSSYGQGGGANATVLAKIDPATGDPLSATFIMARKTNGSANSLVATGLEFLNNGNIQIKANSWFSPLKPNKDGFECQGDSPFQYTLELSSDLSLAVAASALGCQ